MIKKIMGILIIITGLYEVAFSGGNLYTDKSYSYTGSAERNRYEKVYSGYSSKIDLLYKRLDEKNDALASERKRKSPDQQKIERLQNERRIIKRELDNTYRDLRYELRQNNIRDYSYRD